MTPPRQGKKRPAGWLTRVTAANAFGVSERGFDSCIRPLAPTDCVKGTGKGLRFYVRGIIEAWSDRRVDAVSAKAPNGDPMLSGSASPALERYRDERAKLAKLDRLEREKTLVELAMVYEYMDSITIHLRRVCERLETECGARAREIYEAGLQEAVAAAERGREKRSLTTASEVS